MGERLKGRVAIATGAGSGIGRGFALLTAREGAKVVVSDINGPAAEAVAKEIESAGGTAISAVVDVSDSAQIQKMVNTTVEKFGAIDILFNAAGFYRDMPMIKMTEKDFEDVVKASLFGTFYCTKYASAQMVAQSKKEKEAGKPIPCRKIIHVTSGAGIRGNPGQANYSAAKSGIIGLTKSNAKELGRFNIAVNAISPFALTPQTDKMTDDLKDSFTKRIPLGRWGDPEKDIAPVALFLASDDSNYITGQVIICSGGLDM